MILRRLSKAIREQNWFAVVLEFVIVVAGVLLAFQISQMAQARAVREWVRQRILATSDLTRLFPEMVWFDLYHPPNGHCRANPDAD